MGDPLALQKKIIEADPNACAMIVIYIRHHFQEYPAFFIF
jgi:hypothetical protein